MVNKVGRYIDENYEFLTGSAHSNGTMVGTALSALGLEWVQRVVSRMQSTAESRNDSDASNYERRPAQNPDLTYCVRMSITSLERFVTDGGASQSRDQTS